MRPTKKRQQPLNNTGAYRRPVASAASSKERASFPAVGMTLQSYQYDPRDHYRNPGARGVKVKKGWRQRLKEKGTFKRFAIIFIILTLIFGGWFGGKLLWNFHKLFGGNIFGLLSTAKLKGENVGRVNILMAGNSADDVGHDGAELTDSIMILSIGTKDNSAFLLSIPRDLWVAQPGGGHGKINEVFVHGEEMGFNEASYPKGGMGALEKRIEEDLDIDINYYALVNYAAVRDAVNAVGGVDVNIKSDDPRGLYDPSIDYATNKPLVRLSNGNHKLNGQDALNLARARGHSYNSYGFAQSDFRRSENQRLILMALRSKMASAGVLANPAKIASLTDAVGNNVETDFNASEVRRLYQLLKELDGGNIKSLSLNDVDGENLLASYTSPMGQSALMPALGLDEFDDIRALLRRHMSSNPVVREGAKVVVLNGTDYSGLASQEASNLKSKNINVPETGDGENVTSTKIIDASGGKKAGTKKWLGERYGANIFTTTNPYSDIYEADFIIVLGPDRIPKDTSAQ